MGDKSFPLTLLGLFKNVVKVISSENITPLINLLFFKSCKLTLTRVKKLQTFCFQVKMEGKLRLGYNN